VEMENGKGLGRDNGTTHALSVRWCIILDAACAHHFPGGELS